MEEQARRNNFDGEDRRSSNGSTGSAGSIIVQPSGGASSSNPSPLLMPSINNGTNSSSYGAWLQEQQAQPDTPFTQPGSPGASPAGSVDGSSGSSPLAAARQQRLAELYARHGVRRGPEGVLVPAPGRSEGRQQREEWR